ncbi:MAG: cytochrome c oxidase subunit II [Flavobacteriales bacterium]|nr:cytochrome c oxidase subunit II [Flavobacteriales bacterium]
MNFLILLVVIVGIVAIAQLAKVSDLSVRLSGRREEDISHADTRLIGSMFVVFYLVLMGATVYLYRYYGNMLPESASAHGVDLDWLMNFNWWIITPVFVLVNGLLFFFAWKYAYDPNRKATFFAHDNRLELIWTVIPSIVMAVIIIYGLKTWAQITDAPSEDALHIELYSKQFDWSVRYPGADGEFGQGNYNFITSSNPLGLITRAGSAEVLATLQEKIDKIDSDLAHEVGLLHAERETLKATMGGGDHGHDDHGHDDHDHDGHAHNDQWKAIAEQRIAEIDHLLAHGGDALLIWTDAKIETQRAKKHRLERHRERVLDVKGFEFDSGVDAWEAGLDDQIVKGEFHIPVGREVEFVFRSRDVIHSAYMPHFRAQMNTVPGVPTRFKMTPIITTDSMRTILGDPDFNYILLCNKICGAAHFNMKMDVVVDSPESYEAWLAEQEVFVSADEPEGEVSAEAAGDSAEELASAEHAKSH